MIIKSTLQFPIRNTNTISFLLQDFQDYFVKGLRTLKNNKEAIKYETQQTSEQLTTFKISITNHKQIQ